MNQCRRKINVTTTPIGSEISPGMTILPIWLLAAEKTRRQDGREVAWPEGGGVIVAGVQKSRLRRVGEVCCSNFGVGSFSLGFSAGFGGGRGSHDVLLLFVVLGYTKTLIRRETRPSRGGLLEVST